MNDSDDGQDEAAKQVDRVAKELTKDAEKVKSVILKMKDQMDEEGGGTEKGMSIIELKNHLMLEYLINLSYLVLKKTSGKKIEGDEAVERLVTNRTVLEKMRPIEQKLKYQVDKAVKVADSGEIKADDPIHFRANPGALMSKLGGMDDDDDSDDEEGGVREKRADGGKYKVPKHVPAYYNEENGAGGGDDDGEAEAKKKKKQQLSKALIEDLKRQHLDTPEEIFEAEDTMRKTRVDAARERQRYEEEHFMRLPISKRDKKLGRRKGGMSTVATIGDEVTAFGKNYFTTNDDDGGGKKRKRKSGKGGSNKKRKFKK